MKESGGALIIFAGLVLVIAGFNGTLSDVWHALLKQSGSGTAGNAPGPTPSTGGGGSAGTPRPAGRPMQSPTLSVNIPGSGVATN